MTMYLPDNSHQCREPCLYPEVSNSLPIYIDRLENFQKIMYITFRHPKFEPLEILHLKTTVFHPVYFILTN